MAVALDGEYIRAEIMAAGVQQYGHTVLNSGVHTMVKLDMERLTQLPNRHALVVVMGSMAEILFENGVTDMVPVPNGALDLAQSTDSTFPMDLPRILPSEKRASRDFSFESRLWVKKVIRSIGRLAVFDDVISTGGAAAAMAATIREINPDIEIGLYAIWRRGVVTPEAAAQFSSQQYLIEEPIPAWDSVMCPPSLCTIA